MSQTYTLQTRQKTELIDVTTGLEALVAGVDDGLAFFSTRQPTAALLVAELTPELRLDFVKVVENLLAPFRPFKQMRKHTPNAEAHIFAALVGQSVTVAVEGGRLALGEGQRVLLVEFDGPQRREISCKVIHSGQTV